MKFNVEYRKDEGIRIGNQIGPQIEYTFEEFSIPLTEHIKKIINQFEQSGVQVEQEENCCLQSKEEKLIDPEENIGIQLAGCKDSQLILTLHPRTKANQIISSLKEKQKIKETVFYLKSKLENDFFAEAFICEGGIPVLVDTATVTSGNTQSYTLSALHIALFHLQGICVFLETTDLVSKLYRLLSSGIVSVSRQTLELLVLICTFDEKGAEKLKLVAKEDSGEPFSVVVQLLESGDLDTQVNSLVLMNSILASSGEDIQTIVNDLKLQDVLKPLLNIENENFKVQVRLFESITKLTLGPNTPIEEKRKKQKEFVQPLFPLMKKEFCRSQRKMNDLLKSGDTLPLYVKTPLRRYAEQLTQLDTNLSSAFRDEGILQETIEKLEKQVSSLQAKLKTAKNTNKKVKTKGNSLGDSKYASTVDDTSSKKRRKHRKLDEGEELTSKNRSSSNSEWLKEKEQLESKIESLTNELQVSRSQYQEASTNVKKLAQVVKLMKTKYDNLQCKQDTPQSKEETHQENVISNSLDISKTNRIGYTGYYLDIPIRIDSEEIIIIQTNQSNNNNNTNTKNNETKELESQILELTKRNEDLTVALDQVASLDSLTSLIMEPDLENDDDALSPKDQNSIDKTLQYIKNFTDLDCIWNSNNIAKYDNVNETNFPPLEDIIIAIKLLDDQILSDVFTKKLLLKINTDKGDSLVKQLCESLPNVKERLSCWIFVNSFGNDSSIIEKKLDCIIDSVQQLRSCEAIEHCFSVLCKVHGNNSGVYPESLSKILEIRDDKNQTILRKMMDTISLKSKTTLNQLKEDLDGLSFATTADLASIKEDIQSVKNRKNESDNIASLVQDEEFNQFYFTRSRQEDEILECLLEQWTIANDLFVELAEYYTADKEYARNVSSSSFFDAINHFRLSLITNWINK